jgi:hypothetical protein
MPKGFDRSERNHKSTFGSYHILSKNALQEIANEES